MMSEINNFTKKKTIMFGLMELAIFAAALFLAIPSVPSDDSHPPNNFIHIWVSWIFFLTSRLIAASYRKRSFVLAVAESILFLIFLNVLALRFTIR